MKLFRRHPEVFILIGAALATRLWGLFTPAAVVFDEVYFKVYAGDYLKHSYYFDPHPPLGKLLLAGWAWLTHLDPSSLTGTGPVVALRILPALAGAAIIPIFYAFLRQLGASRRIATLGATLLLLDNALLVESRFVLIDSMLIAFGLGAVTCFLAARRRSGRGRTTFVIAAALLAGLAASTKWTGLTALGLIGLIWTADQIFAARKLRRDFLRDLRKRVLEGIALIFIPILVYLSVFWVHFSLLTTSGQGDAFMSPRFQSTLVGNQLYNPSVHMNFWDKFIDLNHAMSQSEETLKTATHPYGSKWSSWPIMYRSVYYWQGETLDDGTQGNIYLLGNPAVWWGILIIVAGGCLASSKALHRLRNFRFALIMLGAGYLMNFLPFSRIVRVMFLYHYLFALIYSLAFAVLMLGALADWNTDGPTPWKFSSPVSKNLYIGVLTVALICFLYFAPLSYGFPLTPTELAQHMWLPSWR